MYNTRQIRCMEAIGLVPWVRRTADTMQEQAELVAAPLEAPSGITPQSFTEQSPTEGSPAGVSPSASKQQSVDQPVVVSGNTDSSLLLIFDVRDGSAWPLSKADDALLDGMLRAIGMSKASVCHCTILQEQVEQPSAGLFSDLKTVCQAPRKHFLYFGGELIAADATDPIPISQASYDGAIDGWQLPTLAMLREMPQRKRQAWITLKTLRSALTAAC